MEDSDIKKLKDPEDENRRLKQMFADLRLECRTLKDVIEKSFKISTKPVLVGYLITRFTMNTRQARRTLSLSRTVYFYQPDTPPDEPVILALIHAHHFVRCQEAVFNALFQGIGVHRLTKAVGAGDLISFLRRGGKTNLGGAAEVFEDFTPGTVFRRAATVAFIDNNQVKEV